MSFLRLLKSAKQAEADVSHHASPLCTSKLHLLDTGATGALPETRDTLKANAAVASRTGIKSSSLIRGLWPRPPLTDLTRSNGIPSTAASNASDPGKFTRPGRLSAPHSSSRIDEQLDNSQELQGSRNSFVQDVMEGSALVDRQQETAALDESPPEPVEVTTMNTCEEEEKGEDVIVVLEEKASEPSSPRRAMDPAGALCTNAGQASLVHGNDLVVTVDLIHEVSLRHVSWQPSSGPGFQVCLHTVSTSDPELVGGGSKGPGRFVVPVALQPLNVCYEYRSSSSWPRPVRQLESKALRRMTSGRSQGEAPDEIVAAGSTDPCPSLPYLQLGVAPGAEDFSDSHTDGHLTTSDDTYTAVGCTMSSMGQPTTPPVPGEPAVAQRKVKIHERPLLWTLARPTAAQQWSSRTSSFQDCSTSEPSTCQSSPDDNNNNSHHLLERKRPAPPEKAVELPLDVPRYVVELPSKRKLGSISWKPSWPHVSSHLRRFGATVGVPRVPPDGGDRESHKSKVAVPPRTLEQEYREAHINYCLAEHHAQGAPWASCDMSGLDIMSMALTEWKAALEAAKKRLMTYRSSGPVSQLIHQVEQECASIIKVRSSAYQRSTQSVPISVPSSSLWDSSKEEGEERPVQCPGGILKRRRQALEETPAPCKRVRMAGFAQDEGTQGVVPDEGTRGMVQDEGRQDEGTQDEGVSQVEGRQDTVQDEATRELGSSSPDDTLPGGPSE